VNIWLYLGGPRTP